MEALAILKISLANTADRSTKPIQDIQMQKRRRSSYVKLCKKLVLVKERYCQAKQHSEATKMIDAWHEDLRVNCLELERTVTGGEERVKEAGDYHAKQDGVHRACNQRLS